MNLEKNLEAPRESRENIKKLDELFEGIKTPEELLEFMGKNIKYGYIGRGNQKAYSSREEAFNKDFLNEYYLQDPEQLLNSRRGVCWDQVELERWWFSNRKFDFKTYFLMYAKQEPNNLPTHTFLVYKNNGKFYWFENSFSSQRGIREYENFDTLIADVKNKQFDYAKKICKATEDDFKTIVLREYEAPEFGCGPDEFINGILDNNSEKA